MKLLLGTSNKGKVIEISEALAGLNVEIVTPAELDITDVPTEEGETFAENARQKAMFYYERSGLPTLADDSGILVEALQNELGIHTRRWGAGPDASDYHWIEFFLNRMRDEKNKKARFVCNLCFIDELGTEHLFEGVCDGIITNELEADYLPGLPISACFKPEGQSKVYSALAIEEKNKISHRGRAILNFREYLKNVSPH
jgi:non-canonical purine NTP pyrophosphatase (RdgB/HAM1 family)